MATLDELYEALVELNEERTLELARKAMEAGQATHLMLLNTCQQALRRVGERYERQEYFLTGLVVAGELFKEVLELAEPLRQPVTVEGSCGTVLLGTVSGDIHDIGKNVFATALRSYGFVVVDLGVDVAKERFLEEIRSRHPDVVCMSGLILAAFESMRHTTRFIRTHDKELSYRPPIVIGGGTIDSDICEYVGADSWSSDAMEGVRICQKLVAHAGTRPA